MKPTLAALLLLPLASCALLRRGPIVHSPEVRGSGLVVQDLVVPDGREAREGDVVRVHYHGTLANGEVFDSSVERGQPVTFALGAGDVSPVLDEGVVGMHALGRRRLSAPVDLVFPGARPAGVPEGSRLVFEVELLAIEDAPASAGSPVEGPEEAPPDDGSAAPQ